MKRRKSNKRLRLIIFLIFVLFAVLLVTGIKKIIKSTVEPKVKEFKLTANVSKNNKDIQNIIWELAKKLKVPEKLVKFYSGKDAIYFSFGLNRNLMELYYANAVITTTIEHNGGIAVSGTEQKYKKQQILKFFEPKEKQYYVIRIYYGDKKYYPVPKRKLAIIVDDFGYFNGEKLTAYCKLDTNVTFAIIPRLKYSKKVMYQADKYHHETLIHIPMEPLSYPKQNPGKYAIYINQTPQKMKKLLESFIEELPLCVGANNHMGSLITSDEDAMKIILTTLNEHNLFFIDSHTTASSVVKKVANDLMMQCYVNYLFMDNKGYKKANLKEKFKILRRNKNDKIVVITHCGNDKRFEYLKSIIKMAKKEGYQLIPASKLYKNDLPEIL